MNYMVRKGNLNPYEVVEVATDTVIQVHQNYTIARERAKFYNRGGGFDGWTPDFFLKNHVSFVENRHE